MECTSPLHGFQTVDGSVIFSDFGRTDVSRSLTLRCGQCMQCRCTAALKWSVRCMHEAKLYGVRNMFVTLTVSDEWLPQVFPRESLVYRPFQLFQKRLRKKLSDETVRFRMSAEYGENDPLGRVLGRPHFHALEFNVWPDDAKRWSKAGDGSDLFRSAELEKLWPYGTALFGRVTPESAAYVNSYVQKKIGGDMALEHYRRIEPETGEVYELLPEFARSSTRPPIGIGWFERYLSDYVNSDAVVLRGGAKVGMPKAYDNWLERSDPELLEEMKFRRELLGRERFLANPNEQSEERLAVKDEVTRARLKSKGHGVL